MTFTLLAAAVLVNGVLIGFIPALVDGVQKPLKARLKLPDGTVNWFSALFYFAWLPGMPLAGWMLDTWHNKEILFFGLVALVLAVAWLAMVATPTAMNLNAIVLGLAYSCVTTATISFMPRALFPDYVDTEKLSIAALNLGFVMVGLGAMIGPWLVPRLESWFGFSQGLLYLSTVFIAPAALAALCDRDLFPPKTAEAMSWDEIYYHPHLILVGLAILFYFALESCLEFWPKSLKENIDTPDTPQQDNPYALAQGMQPVFWLAFIATRGAAAWWLYHHPGHFFALTLILVGASTVILYNVVGGFGAGDGKLWFWLLGACYGPLLPGFLGRAIDLYHPKAIPVFTLGILLAVSGLDTLIVRPAMTFFTKGRAPRSMIWAPLGLSLVLWLPLIILVLLGM